jgi:hypothetical protein
LWSGFSIQGKRLFRTIAHLGRCRGALAGVACGTLTEVTREVSMLNPSTKLGQPRQPRRLALALTFATIGLAACGSGSADKKGADRQRSAAPRAASKKIIIKTRLAIPTGEVVGGSSIGDSPFCPGGTFRDRNGNPDIGSVDRTVRCSGGNLRIGFSPGEPRGHTQAGPWKIISGTGAYKGLRGSGRMEVTFESGSSSKGRETFTGTVVP